MTRASGILLHITSLPTSYGIGDLGPTAFSFIDFLHKAKQKYWQILPLGPTGVGNSPYAPFSAFAGNPLLISPELLQRAGWISSEDLSGQFGGQIGNRVNYAEAIKLKPKLLKQAFQKFQSENGSAKSEGYRQFCKQHSYWLEDYATFMAFKGYFGGKPWIDWPRPIAIRDKQAMLEWQGLLANQIAYYKFEQFIFFTQWKELRSYARERQIQIIGDLPIFVAHDSADVWANPELFHLDNAGNPKEVAGVPPDYFSATGQLWGNPLYNWPQHRRQGYQWWLKRFEVLFSLVDIVRIDHFRGFEAYWAVPASAPTAAQGRWKKGPGRNFFQAVRLKFGRLPLIAEDLGFITPEVEELRDSFDLPGIRVLQFAFDGLKANVHTPHNHVPNAVVYTGTHDNDTVVGWYTQATQDTKEYTCRYLGVTDEDIAWAFIRSALSSVANLAIIPMQDLLCLGSEARMNTPGTAEGNWEWSCPPEAFNDNLATALRNLTDLYGR